MLPELFHRHGGEEVAPHLIQTLQAYEIEDTLGYTADDNANANDILCCAIGTLLEGRNIS